MTMARPSSSESRTAGLCIGTSSVEMSQLRIGPSSFVRSVFLVACLAALAAGRFRPNSILTRMVIAIDGPAGAGKSTVARAVARALGITYLNSGAMYRCVALAALRAGASLDDGVGLERLARGLEIGLADGGVLLER